MSDLFDLVGRLGVERRHAVRVRFPAQECHIHPMIEHGGTSLKIHDISIGGCCLFDPMDVMGANVGHEILLDMHWADQRETTRARVVASVEQKRHIQFLNLPQTRIEQLRFLIEPGNRGTSVRIHSGDKENGPELKAQEIWSSFNGDHVTIEDHTDRLGQIGLFGAEYTVFRNAWPVRDGRTPLSRQEAIAIILFICNINQPSRLLNEFLGHLQRLSLVGAK